MIVEIASEVQKVPRYVLNLFELTHLDHFYATFLHVKIISSAKAGNQIQQRVNLH